MYMKNMIIVLMNYSNIMIKLKNKYHLISNFISNFGLKLFNFSFNFIIFNNSTNNYFQKSNQ